VILGAGDPEESKDKDFFIPGRAEPLPGVFLHACAVQTFSTGYLRTVTPLGMIVADLLLALFVFGGIEVVRSVLTAGNRRPVAPLAVFLALLLLSVVIAITAGIVAVSKLRILWDGVVFVLIAAVAHLIWEVIQDSRLGHASRRSVDTQKKVSDSRKGTK